MNCPQCGRNVYPAQRWCNCGHALRVPAPPIITRRLREIGLDRQPGETAQAYAARCRQWLAARREQLPVSDGVRRQLSEDEREAVRGSNV